MVTGPTSKVREMSDTPTRHVSAMEGKGAYNRHAAIPAAGGALAIPLLEEAARRIPLDAGDRPVVVADYGSSQGKNSLAPMRAAIVTLRARIGPERPVLVYHTDLPGNDFSELFSLLETDPDSYLRAGPNVFPYAIGRSFYQSVFPPNFVDLGWSSYAAVWLSQLPRPIPDHIFFACSTGAVRAEFERQAALDWRTFLSRRAAELRRGGRLVVALPALDHDGATAFQPIMDIANETLAELVASGFVTAEERSRMALAGCPRRESDLLAPFARDGQFEALVVEHCSIAHPPDTAWIEYERDKDAMALATKRALFFRVIFVPSLAEGLAPGRSAQDRQAFADRLEEGIRRRLIDRPARIDHLTGMIVVAKTGGG